MGILAQTTLLGSVAVAPCGYLYTCVPLVVVALLCIGSQIACAANPATHHKVGHRREHTVLLQQDVKEALCGIIEHLAVLCLVCSHYLVINIACLLGYSLTCDIYKVVAEVGVCLYLMRCLHHKLCGTYYVVWIVKLFHLRPRRHLIYIQCRTCTQYRLVTTLLQYLIRCTIYRACKQHPSIVYLSVVDVAIACLNIAVEPFLPTKLVLAPRQFAHQLVHNRVVLYTLHCQSDTLQCRCKLALTCLIILVYHVLQLAIQANVASEVQQHTESPVVSVESFLAQPCRLRVAPLRTCFRVEVKHKHIAILEVLYHCRIRACAPSLSHPHSLWVGSLHGSHNSLASLAEVYTTRVAALMEGVHTIIVGLAIELLHLLIIYSCNLGKTLVGRQKEGRTLVVVPLAGVCHIQTKALLGIVRHHTRVAWQTYVDAKLLHTLHYLLLQTLALFVPVVRVWSAPTLKVVHKPPCLEARTCNKLVCLIL